MVNFEPFYDFIFVKTDSLVTGTVVAQGPLVLSNLVGERVIFSKDAGEKFKSDDDTFVILKLKDIFGYVK